MNHNEIGHQSLEAFVSTVKNVILDSDKFKCIVAASDSGNLAAYITKEVYYLVDKAPPPSFIAPIFRHVDKERTIIFDNSVLKDSYSEWQGRDLREVLFVDDEIWKANTFNGVIDLLFALNVNINSCVIVAEDGGFIWSQVMRGIAIRFIPTKQRLPEIYNAFSYVVPQEFSDPIRVALQTEPMLNEKQIMCTLLNLPIKARENGVPFFTDRLIQQAMKAIMDFEVLQNEFRLWFQNLIKAYASREILR